jgi:cell division septation protein DedD
LECSLPFPFLSPIKGEKSAKLKTKNTGLSIPQVFPAAVIMGLIKKKVFITFLLFLFMGTEQWAQSPNPWPDQGPRQFGTEILNLEKTLANPGISAYERYNALVRLARLRQLSGNISGAAANWLDAAGINPNDDNALVSGAYCLTAIGEWERAYQVIQPLITSARRSPAVLQAFYLDAYLRSFSNASPLVALTGDLEFASLRPTIYYTLWQILTRNPNISGAGNADFWKARLITEYPGSPEALIANGAASVSAIQSPMWLLFPGTSVPGSTPTRPVPPVTPVEPAWPPSQQTVPSPPPPVNAPSAGVLQTGIFSREVNAHNMAEALRKAGFTATVSRKTVNGEVRWVVTVPAGQNQNKTIQDLKKAGFDSFPVR